ITMIHGAAGRDECRLHKKEADPAEQEKSMNVDDGRTMKTACGNLRPISGSKPAECDRQKADCHPEIKIPAFASNALHIDCCRAHPLSVHFLASPARITPKNSPSYAPARRLGKAATRGQYEVVSRIRRPTQVWPGARFNRMCATTQTLLMRAIIFRSSTPSARRPPAALID